MNDEILIAQIPPEVLSAIPSKYIVYANAGVALLFILGRVYHAVLAGGGLVSIWRGLVFGTNTPTPKQVASEAAAAQAKANIER